MASRSPSIADAEKLLARAEFRVLPTLLEKAVVLVSQHGITCQIAASACGLSKWAVWRGVKAMNNGRTPGVVGRPTALTPTEEASIIQMIDQRAKANDSVRTWELVKVASDMLETRVSAASASSSNSPSDSFVISESRAGLTSGWRHSFVKRHAEELKVQSPRLLEPERAAVTPEELNSFFFQTLNPLRLERKYDPSLVANFDETMLQILKDKTQCLIPSSQRHAFVIQEDAPFNITFAMTIFADGTDCKPLLILPQLEFPQGLPIELIHFCSWSGQSAGWISAEIWADWVKKTFIPEISNRRQKLGDLAAPALLLVDGHSTRGHLVTLELLRQNNVDVVTFVAHASHLLQPLDLWVYMQFKSSLRGVRASMRQATRTEKRKVMIQACERAYRIATTPSIIIRSWELSGIHPWNPAIVLGESDIPERNPPATTPARTPRRSYISINNRVLSSPEVAEELRKQAEMRSTRVRSTPQAKRQRTARQNTSTELPTQN